MVCGKTPPASRRLHEYGLYSGYHRSCLLRLWLNGLRRPPPPPGRSAASSRPLERGRAVCGDSPDSRARGEGEDFGVGDRIEPRICSSWPWHCIDRIPPPRGGWNIPSPVSCVSLKTPPPGTPPPLQSLRNGVSQKGARRCRHPESVHGGAASTPDAGGSLENRCSRRIGNYFN